MASFTSSNASPSNYQIRNTQESDPKDDSYNNSDNNSITSIINPNIFKKPSKKNDEFKNKKGNKNGFNFKPPNSYLIRNKLFNYKLADINYSTPRKVIFTYTIPNYNSQIIYKATRAQISSNRVKHYKEKHS
jgi:hypothetical protein